MWSNINQLFDVNDEHFIVGVRELTNNGIEIRIESVGSRIPGEVAIYVQDHVVRVAKEIMDEAYDVDIPPKPDVDHVIRELYEDSLEIGPICEKMTLWVTTQFVGFHKWDNAPDEVAYLRGRHRHTFNVRVGIDVTAGNDRELEFHMIKSRVNAIIDERLSALDDVGSCEMICKQIVAGLIDVYGNRTFVVETDEDGECGAIFVSSQLS